MSFFSILISLFEIQLKNHNPLISQQFCILNYKDHALMWGVIFIIEYLDAEVQRGLNI
jgi:hypothetical protein